MNTSNLLKFIILRAIFLVNIATCYAMDIEAVETTKITRYHWENDNLIPVEFDQKTFGELEKTDQYDVGLRRICVVHPYNLTGKSDEVQREYLGMPTYLFMAKKPLPTFLKESPSLEKYVENLDDRLANVVKYISRVSGLPNHQVYDALEIGVCVQNAPWSREDLLLRPHYWAFDRQNFMAENDSFSERKDVQALILSPTDQHLDSQTDVLTPLNFSITIHADKKHNTLQIISSPPSMTIKGLHDNTTTYFWSFVREGNKFCLTMHWLLSDNDFILINKCEINSLESLMQKLSSYSDATFSRCNLENQPSYPALKYVLDYLKKMYPNCEYNTLENLNENKLLEHACTLVNLGKFNADSGALAEALQTLKIEKEIPQLQYVLGYHLSRDVQKFTKLTIYQRKHLLRTAGLLVVKGKATRDTDALDKALNLL